MKEDKLTKLQNFVMSLFKQEIKLTEIKSKDGYTFMSPDEEISVGSEIYQIDAEGNKVPLVGEVEIMSEEGKIYKTNDGKVIEIEMMEEKPEEEKPEMEMEADVNTEAEVKLEEDIEENIEDSIEVENSLEQRISKLESMFENLISSTEKVAEFSKELSLSLEEIKKIPASNSIKINVNPNRELTPTELRFERIQAIKNNIN